jgi:TonB family protein
VARFLGLLRAYANGDPGLDYRSRALGNLVLALGFSSALHAAVLSSLEGLAPGPSEGPKPGLTVQLKEQSPARRGVSAPMPADRATTPSAARPRAAVPGRYLPLREVDTPARPRGTVPLIYPENPLIWKLGGVVRLRLLINEHGIVDAAQVVSAQPEGEFEEAALAAARRLVYDPALRNGRPVRSEKLIEVTFDPYEQAAPR